MSGWLSEPAGVPGIRYAVTWKNADGKWYKLVDMDEETAEGMFESLLNGVMDAVDRTKATQEIHKWSYAPKVEKSYMAEVEALVL